MKETIKIILAFILGILICGAVVCASTLLKASDVSYKDTTVNDALNELFDLANKKGPTKIDATSTDTHKGIVYLDPTDLTRYCDATNSLSITEIYIGCMKWYIFAEDDDSYTMILDHNTTALVAWNSSGSSSSGMNEIKTALESDTSYWKVNARLITAKEIATITGNTAFDLTSTYTSWFYLDGASGSDSTWHTKIANSTNKSNYAWLYDYTDNCTSWGCNIEDSNTSVIYGYWTNTPLAGRNDNAWIVRRDGCLNDTTVSSADFVGLRPVITVSKDVFK